MRPSVIFIAGASRSGSTLLELMLGSMRGVAPLGEVHNAWQRGAEENQLCGCGRRFSDCPIWSEVMAALDVGGFSSHDLLQLQRYVVRNRRIVDLVRMGRGGRGSAEARQYVAALGTLYRTAVSLSGSPVIVDSSKRPAHGLVLGGVNGIDLSVVHLVRDSRAMAFSAMKKVAKSDSGRQGESMRRLTAWQSARGWNRANLMAETLRGVTNRYLLVRYEDLVTSPRRVMERISQAVGVEADLSWLDDDQATLAAAHTVSGNPIRMARGPVTLREDDAWRERMRTSDRHVVTASTLPLLARYGYKPNL